MCVDWTRLNGHRVPILVVFRVVGEVGVYDLVGLGQEVEFVLLAYVLPLLSAVVT